METILLIPINHSAPVACDMSAATDTGDERLKEYRQLFARALLNVGRKPGAVEFRFASKPGVRDWCIDLATREAACCPFLGYQLTSDDTDITWTTTGDEHIEAVRVFLDMFQSAPAELLKTPGALANILGQNGYTFTDDAVTIGYSYEPGEPTTAIR